MVKHLRSSSETRFIIEKKKIIDVVNMNLNKLSNNFSSNRISNKKTTTNRFTRLKNDNESYDRVLKKQSNSLYLKKSNKNLNDKELLSNSDFFKYLIALLNNKFLLERKFFFPFFNKTKHEV